MANYFNREIECADREKLRAIQSERLVNTVKYCYENVPFYKKKFDEKGLKPEDIKSIDDISKLPFTLKSDLRDNYPFGLFAAPREKLARIQCTSGTSGKKTVVGYTKNDINSWSEAVARALVAAGAKKSDYVHISYGYGLFTGGLGLHYGAEYMGATVIPVSTGNTMQQIQIMQDFGSNILACTPSYATYIGETLQKHGIDPKTLELRAGIFGGEPWSENMRKEIEKSLNIKAYDIYGIAEITGPGVAYDCEEQSGLHINEDMFYPEIINSETLEPVPDGEYGELVFTCLSKEALPLLRYRTYDISKLSHEKCSCGRTLVKMCKTVGRADDMLVIKGVNVFPSQVEHVILSLGLDPHYQIIVDRVDNTDTMTVCVEMNQAMFSDSMRKIEESERKIEAELQKALGIFAKVHMVEPNSIPRTDGKSVKVIDNRKI